MPDALGLKITLEYPRRWAEQDGKRRPIVRSFLGELAEGAQAGCILQVSQFSKTVLNNLPTDGSTFVFSQADVYDLLSEGATLVGYTNTQLENCPAVYVDCSTTRECAGLKLYVGLSAFHIILNDKMITYALRVGGKVEDKDTVDGVFPIYEPCFHSMVNSIVIHNRWDERE